MVLLEFELLPNGYVGWFFIVLSVIEACSVYFKKNLVAMASNHQFKRGSKVVFDVNADGVRCKSGKVDRSLAWNDIDQLEQTDLALSFTLVNNANT